MPAVASVLGLSTLAVPTKFIVPLLWSQALGRKRDVTIISPLNALADLTTIPNDLLHWSRKLLNILASSTTNSQDSTEDMSHVEFWVAGTSGGLTCTDYNTGWSLDSSGTDSGLHFGEERPRSLTTTSNGVGSARSFPPFGLPAPAFQALLMAVECPRAPVCRYSSTVSVSRF
ncbi:hypothetical protein BD414DRAFT_532206 [Trametes punicea]|nr:hypothetical protein BD414DRAFT_532206 [Trametes punicea]